jgi:membrane fusion protein (multidrug efflux system)
MKVPAILLGFSCLALTACSDTNPKGEEYPPGHQTIVVTSPAARDVVLTQPYVCQIHSRRHIEVRALKEGYLEAIRVKEGEAVKKGQVLFRVIPVVYKAKRDAASAKAEYARVEFANTKKLYEQKVVSAQEVKLYQAKLAEAEAEAKRAEAELKFTEVTAPFDGVIDRFHEQQGSLVEKDALLTTLSDNSVMWVYFNVPEARYLEYKSHPASVPSASRLKIGDSRIELRLADGRLFDQTAGDVVTVEGQFNNETGNIQFRADFPNPRGLLRHGETGTVLVHQTLRGAVVIPQRATFEVLDKRYVYAVGDDHVAHRRLITVRQELEDIFVIKSGLTLSDKIVLEGAREVHEGEKIDYEFRKPDEALSHQKFHAE